MKKADPIYNEMNDITAAYIYAVPDVSIRKFIPPPLELAEPVLLIMYVSSIKKPTFSEAYMEGGIGVITNLEGKTGQYYFNLQLSGQGAQNAAFFGREEAGLPKKFADSIRLQRIRDRVFFHIERNGVRLLDAHIKTGSYNDHNFSNGLENLDPSVGLLQEGAVFTHRYSSGDGGIQNMQVYYYDSPTFFCQYELAYARVKLQSSLYDPWGEIKIEKILGGAYAKCNNYVIDVKSIYSYPDEEAVSIMQYLWAGRFDPLVGRRGCETPFYC